MESIVEVPPKKSKFKSPVNVHVTSECVRQFKLPRQYPSTVPGLPSTKAVSEKTTVATVQTKNMQNLISALPFSGKMKFVPNKEVMLSRNLQKLKLKAPDGRDLGEVKLVEPVQDEKAQPKIITYSRANQNSEKAKTWTLKSHNSMETQKPRIKTITKIINTSSSSEESTKEPEEQASPRMVVQVINTSTEANNKIIPKTKISTSSGIKSSTQKVLSHDNDGDLITKFILENPSILEKQNGQSQVITIKKLPGSQKLIMMQRDNQIIKSVPDKVLSLKPITQNSLKNHNITNNSEKIIFKSSINGSVIKKRACSSEDLRNFNSKKQCMEIDLDDSLDNELLDKEGSNKSPTLKSPVNQVTNVLPRKNIMVIVPNEAAEELSMTSISERINSEKEPEEKQSDLSNYSIPADINQFDDFLDEPPIVNNNQESVAVSTENQSSTEIINEVSNKNNQSLDLDKFSILKKAVLSVQDATLRAKALKALQDCGIKVKKTVPIKRPVATKTIIDSQTQTEVFSLLKKDELLHVTEEKEDLVKIKLTRKLMKQPMNTLSINKSANKPPCQEEENYQFKFKSELDSVLEKLFANNEGISNVKEAFSQNKVAQARFLLNQLKADYKATQTFDDDGLLGIHRAVMNDNIREVQRNMLMLKKVKKSIDVCTQDDKTSLELAVEFEVNPQIVKILLDAGAQPVSSKPIHDSAIILAAKKSSKILSLLFQYVNRNQRSLLNAKDSEGLAAIHYCAQFGNLEGVTELLKLGADVNLQDDKSGRTALFYAVDTKNSEVPQETYNDIAHKLLDHGAISNIPIFSKHSVLSLIDDVKSHTLKIALNKAVK